MSFFGGYDTLGNIEVKCSNNYEYTIYNSFEDVDMETVFFLFLTDKVMADSGKPSEVAQILVGYLLDISGGTEELEEEFSQYEKVNSIASDTKYSISQELRSKDKGRGKHLYVNTSFDSFWSLNADKKSINATILYMMNIRKRFPSRKWSNLGQRFSDMLRFYDNNGYPSTTSVTDGPSHIVDNYSMLKRVL